MNNKKIIAATILLSLSSGGVFAEGNYSLGIGADYSNGDYGTDSTATLWSLPLSLSYRGERWGWGITVPYLILRSSGNVVVGSGGVIGTGSPHTTTTTNGGGGPGGGGAPAAATTTTTNSTTTESGLGDVTLRGSVNLLEEGEIAPWMGFTVKAKLATADENKFLGTGENDYAAQLEMAKGMVDGYVGYKYLGDPTYIDFNNVAYGALAFTLAQGRKTYYTVEGYFEQAAVDGYDPKQELSLIYEHRFNNPYRISGYLLKGFTDSSPDWGGGLALKYSL
ncbi:MAG TPA: hypothetical protein VGE50_11420 [Gammaproteobacteria bacterium]